MDAEGRDTGLGGREHLVELTGIGQVGQTIKVYSLELEQAQVDPLELRSQSSTATQSIDDVIADRWWCQYLKVSLPAEATGWKITSIELYCQKEYR